MQVNTGHLVEDINTIEEEERKDYTPIPERLTKAAKRALKGRSETFIDIKGKSLLAKFAKEEREKKVINKKKMVKASRKKNRK